MMVVCKLHIYLHANQIDLKAFFLEQDFNLFVNPNHVNLLNQLWSYVESLAE